MVIDLVGEVVRKQLEQEPLDFKQFGELLGIPITVRPWWGSVRRRGQRYHKQCGTPLHGFGGSGYCRKCEKFIERGDLEIRKREGEWRCPAGAYYGSSYKAPEVQGEQIILWEGPCGHSSHKRTAPHCQETKIRDIDGKVMLITIWVRQYFSNYLIGVDGRAPFVVPVLRRHTTVKEAFDWLMPNIVKRAIAAGLEVKRQGDWFFIPLPGEPKQEEPPHDLVTSWGEVPFTNPRLQRRVCYSEVDLVYGVRTRHRAELVVYNSFVGLPYLAPVVKGRVYAPDHEDLVLKSWHIGVRNKTSTGGRRENARGQDD